MVFDLFKNAFIVTSLFLSTEVSQTNPVKQEDAPPDKQVTILFAGDIMQHGPQITAAWNDSTGTYDYTKCFQYVSSLVSSYDIAIANLEVTLAGPPFTGYPQFSAPDELAEGAKEAGFDVLVTANNHSCDRGDDGVIRTVMVLDSLGIKRTGTFSDSADYNTNNPLILNANGIKIALLNYTYGTNGLPFQYPAMVNLIDEQKVMQDITYTKSLLPDFILVYFHWGNEYQSYPTRQQVELANACRDMGVDAVIGSHPHVLQPMEYFPTSDSTGPSHLTVFSLGNYVSNQRDRYKDGGAMVSFNLVKTWNRREITEPRYHLTWVHTPYENDKKQYYILPVNQPGLDTILDSQAAEKMSTFINDSRQLLNEGSFAIPEAGVK